MHTTEQHTQRMRTVDQHMRTMRTVEPQTQTTHIVEHHTRTNEVMSCIHNVQLRHGGTKHSCDVQLWGGGIGVKM
eukprot:362553-Chlamydomonas_euryale.AAC.5